MTRRPTRLLVAAVVLLGVVACGPTVPLDLSMQERASTIQYGNQKHPVASASAAPAVVGGLGSNFPSFVAPPVITSPPPVVITTPPACPYPAATAEPALPATSGVAEPPGKGSYTFRQIGKVGSPPTALPASFSDVIGNVHQVPPTDPQLQHSANPTATVWSFDSTETEEGASTVITFWIDPGTSNEVQLQPYAPSADGGLKIAQITFTSPSGKTFTFNPAEPVRVANFPLGTEAAATQDAGTDGVSQTVMTVNHMTGQELRVNTCGDVLQAWDEAVTVGIVNPDGLNIAITGDLFIAPQYGGLIVSDNLKENGTRSGGAAFTEQVTATIDQVPAPAASP